MFMLLLLARGGVPLFRRRWWKSGCGWFFLGITARAVAVQLAFLLLLVALLLLLLLLLLARLLLGRPRRQVCCCRSLACRFLAGSGGSSCELQAPLAVGSPNRLRVDLAAFLTQLHLREEGACGCQRQSF